MYSSLKSSPVSRCPMAAIPALLAFVTAAPAVTSDYGDFSGFQTASAIVSPQLSLGLRSDAESAPHLTVTARGDDETGVGDEDGMALPAAITPGAETSLPLTVKNNTPGTAYVKVWIDLNNDGTLSDALFPAGELAAAEVAVPPGSILFNGAVNISVPPLPEGSKRGMRLRLSTQAGAGPAGAAAEGEVEDYILTFGPQPASCLPLALLPAALPDAVVHTPFDLTLYGVSGTPPYRFELEEILPEGAISWWKANGNALDSIGSNHGTPAATVYADGKKGSAFSFTGRSDSKVTVPDSPQLRPVNQLTLEAWIYMAKTPEVWAAPVIKVSSSAWSDGYGFYRHPDGRLWFFINNSDAPAAAVELPSLSAWHHVAGTYDGIAVRIYVDGIEMASTPASGPINHPASPSNLVLSHYWGGPNPGDGLVDDVALYGRALTAAEIRGRFEAGSNRLLPQGIALEAAGRLAGTPLETGKYSFAVRVTDSAGCTGRLIRELPVRGCAAGNLVWHDENNNGIRDAGEPGLAGATVELLSTGPDGEKDGPDADTAAASPVITPAGGAYRFSNLLPGAYYLKVTPPAGFTVSGGSPAGPGDQVNNDNNGQQPAGPGTVLFTSVFHLGIGTGPVTDEDTDPDTDLTLDIGLWSGAHLGGTAWLDADMDGTMKSNEGKVSAVALRLWSLGADGATGGTGTDADTIAGSTVTGTDGTYTFGPLPGGRYLVEVTPPSELPAATPQFVPTDNGAVADNNGYQRNGSGTRIVSPIITLSALQEPGNAGTGNRELTVDFGLCAAPLDQSDNSAFATAAAVIHHGVRLGRLADAETAPRANRFADGDDRDASADEDGAIMGRLGLGQVEAIPLTVTNNSDLPAFVSAWVDFSQNGSFADAGEQLLTDLSIPARFATGTTAFNIFTPLGSPTGSVSIRLRIATATGAGPTGSAGNGEVEDYVSAVHPPYKDFGDFQGFNAESFDASNIIFLGELSPDIDTGSISDRTARQDDSTGLDDEDGIYMDYSAIIGETASCYVIVTNQSSNIAYVAGWVDFRNDGDMRDAGEQVLPPATIPPGTLKRRIDFTFPVPASASVGTVGTRFKISSLSSFANSASGEIEDSTIRLSRRVSVGDRIWNDANQNGRYDNGEAGVSGVLLTLFNPGDDASPGGSGTAEDTQIGTAVSAADGRWLFSGLRPGKYFISFTPPASLPYVATANPNDDQIDGDSNGLQPGGRVTEVSSPVFELISGMESISDGDTSSDTDLTQDFGLVATSQTLGDFVWSDTNANGIQDTGEQGINGIRVDLYRDNGDGTPSLSEDTWQATTFTASIGSQAGRYSFSIPQPGSYFAVFSPADNWGFSPSGTWSFSQTNTSLSDENDSDAEMLIRASRRVGITAVTRLDLGEVDNSWDAGLVDRSGLPAVWAIAQKPDGCMVLGGRFEKSHGVERRNIAVVDATGAVDQSFNPGTGFDGTVRSLALQNDGVIVVGGVFRSYNGSPANGLALLTPLGSLMPCPGQPNTAEVYWVASRGNYIYVAGDFTGVGGMSVGRVARLRLDGTPDPEFQSGTGANGPVFCGGFSANGSLLIGGAFTSYNGALCRGVAKINADGSLDSFFNSAGGPAGEVYSIKLLADGRIFLTGSFRSYAGIPCNGIVRLHADGRVDNTMESSSLDVKSIQSSD